MKRPGIFHGGGIVDMFEFTVGVHEALPGVGKFIYDDPIVVDPGDEELVVQGHMRINFH